MKLPSFVARSIQAKIASLAGVCLVGTAGILVGYGVLSSSWNNQYVDQTVTSLLERNGRETLQYLAAREARAVQREFTVAMVAARTMAQSFGVLAAKSEAAAPNEIRREQLNRVLRRVLEQNPQLNGTYSAWEPGALDDRDEAFKNRRDAGSDATGRFLPYWTRGQDGKIAIQPLVEYDSRDLHPNGVMKGGWYVSLQEGAKESVLGPLPYIVQGKSVYLATLSVPVMIDGKFRGLAGTDFNLDFVQKLATDLSRTVYGGKSEVVILSDQGLVVAHSGRADLIGQPMSTFNKAWQADLGHIKKGEESVDLDPQTKMLRAFAPIGLGQTGKPWAVLIQVPQDVVLAEAHALSGTLAARGTSTTLWQILVGLLVAVGAIALMWVAARSIAWPIRKSATFAEGIAAGDFGRQLDVEQADEVGTLAATLRRMRDDLQRMIAQRADDQARAEAQRRAEMRSLADGFEAAVGEIVETVSSASGELERAAGTLTRTAETTQRLSTKVASASELASTNVQSVASATNEMASSVHEISRQVQESSRIANEAVKQAEKTDGRINELSQAAARIGDVVKLITAIAEQTNLLALNATIEAARAGEAGKGFAVVAQEVKALAAQTGKATGDISAQIAGMQAATQDSVAAIKEIGGTIGRIAEISATIAAAVEEQGAATQEIARNVQQAAAGTTEVASNIGEVDRGATETGSASSQVLSSAQSLSGESGRLKSEVGKFLSNIRAA
ncbi:methyl-accepting chemotaxis protein [Rhodoplanes sp. TEM]|uniref:Methyl-accepting chemotaxis protein n=1 Tax=Rhodoplanes tepidamans TaxID=200616 RepID=A0ABT5JKS3_RHOTP|nr:MULTISPECIES: methyl-accepting chemotaxis protein [Rhodoplanes]MDC7789859.1 methyl-accepting chemotaxis protein [Rhodoplanes tepidamans]MDC7984876.1 methyl-accepting chemotaxis protein [Rhodoplanes sp. TEM]MDQ0358465.1 methyl-accepting chemotaxis protein [Rhodoplanes tepidamans]